MAANKFLMFVVATLFLISLTAAFEFDNTADYNEDNMTLTVKNCDLWIGVPNVAGTCLNDGEVITETQLTTPRVEIKNNKPNIKVGVGSDILTHTFDVTNYKEGLITNLRAVDMRTGEVVDRNLKIKYLTYVEEVEEYYIFNENNESTREVDTVTKEKWVEDLTIIEGNTYTLGIFADTNNGEYTDILFTLAGVDVNTVNWATWESSLDTGLIHVWKFQDNGIDSLGTYNFTAVNSPNYTTGKDGNATDFELSNSQYFNNANSLYAASSDYGAISLWIYKESGGAYSRIFGLGKSNYDNYIGFDLNDKLRFQIYENNANRLDFTSTSAYTFTDGWHHIVVTSTNGVGNKIYVDNVSIAGTYGAGNAATTKFFSTLTAPSGTTTRIGIRVAALDQMLDAKVDEVYLWDRGLTASEVSLLYDNAFYGSSGDVAPTVTLNSPTNATNYNSNSQSITFNCSVTDDINLDNVTIQVYNRTNALIYSSTNTTGLNNSQYLFTTSLGVGNYSWNCKAVDNSTNAGYGTNNRTFNIYDNAPTVELDSPANATVYNTNGISVNFRCKGIDDVGLSNLTFYIWNITSGSLMYSSTNTDGQNNTLETFAYTLSGNTNYTWTCKATDLSSNFTYAVNNYTVIVFGIPDFAPVVSISGTPSGTTSTTIPLSIDHSCVSTDDNEVKNVSIVLNGVISYIMTSPPVLNNSVTSFPRDYNTDGFYEWYCRAVDNSSQIGISSTWNFTINTTPYIAFVNPTPVNNSNSSSRLVTVNASISTLYFSNWTAYIYNSTGLVLSATYTNSTRTHTFNLTRDGTYYYNATVRTNTSQSNSTSTRIINIDATAPNITLLTPLVNTTTTSLPVNVTINISTSDEHLSEDTSCYYDPTNCLPWAEFCGDSDLSVYFNCTKGANISYADSGYKLIYIYSEDTFGNRLRYDLLHYIYYYNYAPSYYSTVLEGEINYINLNVTATAINTLNATLHYNGTDYDAELLTNNGTFAILSNNFSLPTVTNSENVSFYWTIYLDGIQLNTTNYTQLITALTPMEISLSCSDKAANFTFIDEVNFTDLNATVRYNIKYGHSTNNSLKTLYGTLTNVHNFFVCINSSLGRDYIIGEGELHYNLNGYGDRRFYFFTGSALDDSQDNYSLLLLENAQDQSFKFDFQDTGLNKYGNRFISLLRWYPNINDYEQVEMGKTDDDGYTILKAQLEDVDYRVGLYELNGTLITLKNATRFSCYVEPCTFSSTVTPEETNFVNYYNMETSLTYNYTTKIFTLIYNDPSQETDSVRLLVTRETGTSTLTLCDSDVSGYTGVISCNTSTVEGFKRAIVFRTASPEKVLNEKTVNDDDFNGLSNDVGLIASVVLWLVIVSLGLANSPIWAIILGIVGLAPALVLGSINYAIFTAVAILGAIIIHFIKRSLT